MVFEPLADDVNLVSHFELIEFDRYFPDPCLELDSMFNRIIENPQTSHCSHFIQFDMAKKVLRETCEKRWSEITNALIDITPR